MATVSKRRDRWVLDFYDNLGKRCWKTLPRGTTKAKEHLREIEEQLAKGNYIPQKKIPTFSEVARDWVDSMKPDLRASTWSVYEGHTRNHFEEFNLLKINQITTANIEKYITGSQEAGMNISTLRKVLVTLGQIFAYAVRHGYLSYNPFADAKRPKAKKGESKKNIRILSPEEIQAFLDALPSKKYHTMFKLAIMTGVRQGELIGLKWSDIDWDNRQIHIRRTFNNQDWYDPKTPTSERKIDLGPSMITNLKEWRLACPPNDLDLVFPNEALKPINNKNMLRRHFQPALKKAGIEKIRFHDLRHTYASLMIEQGQNIKYIQTQLGHSTPTVTLNVYAHLLNDTNQDAACRLENMVFGKVVAKR